jgi:hypothetical protein
MSAPFSVDPARFLHEQLACASLDLLRSMLTTFIDTLSVLGDRAGACPHSTNAALPRRERRRAGVGVSNERLWLIRGGARGSGEQNPSPEQGRSRPGHTFAA